LLLPTVSVIGVVLAYSALYILAFILTLYIEFSQKQYPAAGSEPLESSATS